MNIRILVALACIMLPSASMAATTTVTTTVNPGTLSLTNPAAAALSSTTITATGVQSSVGSLGTLKVTDSRGTGAGWILTASISNFTKAAVSRVTGTVGNITASGTYTGATSGKYTVTIQTGGPVGTATYTVSGLETQTATVSGASAPLGTKGLTLAFDAASYASGDQWTVDVSSIPASNFMITPGNVVAFSGSTSGVTAGPIKAFADSNDIATVMTASAGSGLGEYGNTPNLSLTIPASARSGSYTATLVETLN